MTRGRAAILAARKARHAELADLEIAKRTQGELEAIKEIEASYLN